MVSVFACVHICMCVFVCRYTCIFEHTCAYEPICVETCGQTSGVIPQVPTTLDFALFIMCVCVCAHRVYVSYIHLQYMNAYMFVLCAPVYASRGLRKMVGVQLYHP